MTDKKTEALKLALEAMIYADACLKKQLTTKDKHQYAQDLLLEAGTAIRDALAEQPAQQEPVAWRDDVEQRLLTWRQSFVNRSGDQLALDDFMDKRSLDDLIDFVCSEYTSTPASKPLTDEEIKTVIASIDPSEQYIPKALRQFARAIEAKLKEKNT